MKVVVLHGAAKVVFLVQLLRDDVKFAEASGRRHKLPSKGARTRARGLGDQALGIPGFILGVLWVFCDAPR